MSKTYKKGFTLIELLIVMAIIAMLVTIFLVGLFASQRRSRDVNRKSDLKQIANALEIFYSDHERYPAADAANGQIMACDYVPADPDTSTTCSWEGGRFSDGITTYFRELPPDPTDFQYFYVVNTDGFQEFQLFAHLENPDDQNCIQGGTGEPDCENPILPITVPNCGTQVCNFSITSPNVTPADDL